MFELRVEGKGTVWADKLSLMPVENRCRAGGTDVVEAIKDSASGGHSLGRQRSIPGGTDGKTESAIATAGAVCQHQLGAAIDSNDVGIDEFCQFCALVEPAARLREFFRGAAASGRSG